MQYKKLNDFHLTLKFYSYGFTMISFLFLDIFENSEKRYEFTMYSSLLLNRIVIDFV